MIATAQFLRLFVLTSVLGLVGAYAQAAERIGVFQNWSYFCDEVCWAATYSTDGKIQVSVAVFTPSKVQVSVFRRDQKPLNGRSAKLTTHCLNERLPILEGQAYARTGSRDRLVVRTFATETSGTIILNGKRHQILFAGFVDAMRAAGFKQADRVAQQPLC